ncbi:ABC transporter permease [Chachezhania sediminis]|uniref:ABC transporter permease n=1 Tax=Chachezhania sediminis TaxID=2599291 RepID=UPI00131CB342|nr:ABC transporter permease [Chachezhania sediminis]
MTRNSKAGLALIAPLLVLILAGFVLPIASTALKAFDNPEVSAALPRTTVALGQWDGAAPLPDAVPDAFVADLQDAMGNRAFGQMTRRLNFEESGMRSLFFKARRAAPGLERPYAQALAEVDPEWGRIETWQMLKTHSNPYTASYVLRSLDLRMEPDGTIVKVEPEQAIFVDLFIRTFAISIWVTVIAVLLGYPTAYVLSTLKGRMESLALLCVLVPFWISILVRSTAWFIILQREGPINAALQFAGLIGEPQAIIFTRPAVYIAMVHVLLPFFILPLLSVMKRIRADYVRAAASLGARPWQQFLLVYLPMTMPGVAAGALMVFMLSVGFYVTPALVGGLRDQMVSYYIAYFTNTTINLGMAAALSLLLLVMTGVLVAVAGKLMPGMGGKQGARS